MKMGRILIILIIMAFSLNILPVKANAQNFDEAIKGDWFVILGSFPKSDLGDAEKKSESLKKSGYNTQVIDTDNYPNLKNGLWAVVMGPYSKEYAQKMKNNISSLVSDAYIKSVVITNTYH